jgi:hypothetical protein
MKCEALRDNVRCPFRGPSMDPTQELALFREPKLEGGNFDDGRNRPMVNAPTECQGRSRGQGA